MNDLETEEGRYAPTSTPDIVPIFLGLFLLVLAFFILLVSISTFEEVKSSAVMDSLTSTFTTVLPPTSDPTEFNAKDGDIIAGQAFQEQITSIFATIIQVENIEVVQPGRLMRIKLRDNMLFKEGETEVREDRQELLDRIVASLSARPPGLRLDMEVVLGSAAIDGNYLPVGQTQETARLGALARVLIARGAPPDGISVGLKIGDPGDIGIWFWVRGVEETEVRFQDALQHNRSRPAPIELPPTLEVRP